MKEDTREFPGMDQMGDIWLEAYIDRVEDSTDTYGKKGENRGCNNLPDRSLARVECDG
jgi:hypothetical protein